MLKWNKRENDNKQYFSIVYTYIEVLTLRNSDEQKSVFDAKNRPSVTASIFGKLLLFAFIKPGSMAVYYRYCLIWVEIALSTCLNTIIIAKKRSGLCCCMEILTKRQQQQWRISLCDVIRSDWRSRRRGAWCIFLILYL